MGIRAGVLDAINDERNRQDQKWGEQNHRDLYWLGIITEELGEVAKAMIEDQSPRVVREEAIHLGTVVVGFLECLARRQAPQ